MKSTIMNIADFICFCEKIHMEKNIKKKKVYVDNQFKNCSLDILNFL